MAEKNTDEATGETISHSAKPPKNGGQAASYNSASERLLMEPLAIPHGCQKMTAKHLVMDRHLKDAGQAIDETTSHLTKAASCQVIGYGYKLSVIIITKNEAVNIRACLESVRWADEIIVVDSGSVDATVEICRELGAQVHVHDWLGFGIQKNRALSYATHEWVLAIDADERVTPDLKSQLIQAMEDDREDGFYVPRLSQYCGKFIHHSGWYPDYVLRLFGRTKGRFSDDMVHERVILEGTAGRLSSPLLHYSYLNQADVQRKTEQYASAGALQMFKNGKAASLAAAPLRAGWAFFRTYCLRLGFLDGIAGFDIALMNARTTYLKYRQLRALRSTKTAL